MGRNRYLEEELKSEKGQMKKKLWNWGNALERFGWKEEELRKLQMFHELQKKVWEGNETQKAMKALEKIQKEYEAEVKRIRLEMEELLLEKAWIDGFIKKLTEDEEIFVRMRFEKGLGFDFIGMKMHLSRATLFRIQDRVLEKMILVEKKS